MKMLFKLLCICLFMVPLQLCFANVIVVDINNTGDFDTIQTAIDNSVSGDTVLVLPGTYFENINYNGKNVCVMSSAGPDSTIIDGSQPQDSIYQSVVTFFSGEDSTSILSGFTITGGTGWLFVTGSSLSANEGGGIYCCSSSPIIEKNIIRDNIATFGGGISIVLSSSPIIRLNLIWRNKSQGIRDDWDIGASGISVAVGAKPIIINNTIVYNEGLGGVSAISQVEMTLINNIIANNVGCGIHCIWDCETKLLYNNVWNNIPNNFGYFQDDIFIESCISLDPLFVDANNGDFRLRRGSPCISAGDPSYPLDSDGTIADMGALPSLHYPSAANETRENPTLTSYKLYQNYPNPFNPETTIEYQVPQQSQVKIVVINMLGQKIKTLVDQNHQPGIFQIKWNGRNELGKSVPSGIYFYSLISSGSTQIRKMSLLK